VQLNNPDRPTSCLHARDPGLTYDDSRSPGSAACSRRPGGCQDALSVIGWPRARCPAGGSGGPDRSRWPSAAAVALPPPGPGPLGAARGRRRARRESDRRGLTGAVRGGGPGRGGAAPSCLDLAAPLLLLRYTYRAARDDLRLPATSGRAPARAGGQARRRRHQRGTLVDVVSPGLLRRWRLALRPREARTGTAAPRPEPGASACARIPAVSPACQWVGPYAW